MFPLQQPADLDGFDWSPLQHSGQNGLFLVLLGLSWWMAAKKKVLYHVTVCIEDLIWVLDHVPPRPSH